MKLTKSYLNKYLVMHLKLADKLTKLADKLINTINKEENQIIVKNINKNKDKLLERDDFGDWVIQPNDQRTNLLDIIKLILDFNEDQLDLVFELPLKKYKN